ncbi:MAG: Fpg/Nei family DNA glycosylase [Mariniblastus sp.]|nr:Fpg/Nei family DNA glycosylase [Mariniblastus sp.]
MPEGHTIHRIAKDHQRLLRGQSLILISPQGRFSEEAKQLTGKKLLDIEAHGKHLFYRWVNQQYVHVHLGLYGKFRLHSNPAPEPRGAVRVRMIGKRHSVDLNGPNQCEILNPAQYQQIKQRLGLDPLGDVQDIEPTWNRISSSRAAIGSLLLDQSIIAGIGNIYRAELLFLTRIHPERPGKQITRAEFETLWKLTKELMGIGVAQNRIVTVIEIKTEIESLRRIQNRFWIYKNPECPRCHSDVYCWELAGRTIYACDKCQL